METFKVQEIKQEIEQEIKQNFQNLVEVETRNL